MKRLQKFIRVCVKRPEDDKPIYILVQVHHVSLKAIAYAEEIVAFEYTTNAKYISSDVIIADDISEGKSDILYEVKYSRDKQKNSMYILHCCNNLNDIECYIKEKRCNTKPFGDYISSIRVVEEFDEILDLTK